MAGFEPATLCSQSRYATELRYISGILIFELTKKGICLYSHCSRHPSKGMIADNGNRTHIV